MIGLFLAFVGGAILASSDNDKTTTQTTTTTITTNTVNAANCNNRVIYKTKTIVKNVGYAKKSCVDVLLKQGFHVVGFYEGKHLLWNGKQLIMATKKYSIPYIPNKPEFRNTPVAHIYNQLMQKKQKQLTCSSNHSAKPKQIANEFHQLDKQLLPPVKKRRF